MRSIPSAVSSRASDDVGGGGVGLVDGGNA